MRTITNALQGVYNLGPQRSVFARFEIDQTGSGDWVDLTNYTPNLANANWLRAWEYGVNTDEPVSDLVVTVAPRRDEYALSPLLASNPMNAAGVLLQVWRKVRLFTATLPFGSCPNPDGSDWDLVFRGYLHTATLEDSGYKLRCLDEGGDLERAFIEKEREYGNQSFTSTDRVEDIMQDILDDWAAGVTLYSVNGTSGTPYAGGDQTPWVIKRYRQERQSVLSALRVLADGNGRTVRYRFHEGSGIDDFVLVHEQPDTSKTTPDHTFEVIDQLAYNGLALSADTIRNRVVVGYTEANGKRSLAENEDASSQSKYGVWYTEFSYGSSHQIDTLQEANAMGSHALDAMKEPTATVAVTVPYFMVAQPSDLYRFKANDIHWDTDLDLALLGVRHRGAHRIAETVLTVQGVPSSRSALSYLAKAAKYPQQEQGGREFAGKLTGLSYGIGNNGDLRLWSRG